MVLRRSAERRDQGAADFTAFVQAESAKLLRIAYGLTGNPHDAWDLVQETFARLAGRWPQISGGNPAGYAYTTLVRIDIDRGRRLRRERPVEELPQTEAPVTLDEGFDPELAHALRVLPPQQRAAVVLRTIGDLDHATIGERLGCSTATARVHLSRGLARLREELAHREVTR